MNPEYGFDDEKNFEEFLQKLWTEQEDQIIEDSIDKNCIDPLLDDNWAWEDDIFSISTWDDLGTLVKQNWKDYKTDGPTKITVLDNISDFSAMLSMDVIGSGISEEKLASISQLAKAAELSLSKVLQNDLFHLIFKVHAPPKCREEVVQSVDHPVLLTQLINNLIIINLLYQSPRYGEIKKDTSLNILSSAAVMPDLMEGMLKLYLRLKDRDGFKEGDQATQQELFKNGNDNEKWGDTIVQAIKNSGMDKIISSLRIKLSTLENSLASWGLSMSEVSGMSQQQQLTLFNILNSSFHQEITQAASKFLGHSHSKIRTFIKTKLTKNTVVQGTDFQNMMLRDKILMKISPKYFMYKIAEGKVLSLVGFKTKNKGPVVICIDDSGSMDPPMGVPAKWSRTVFIALAQNLIKSDRSLYACLFSGNVPQNTTIELSHKDKKSKRIEKAFAFIDNSLGGGTNFDCALRWVFKKINSNAPLADIIFITDGQCSVQEDRLNILAKKKRDCQSKFYLVLIQQHNHPPPNIVALADKTYKVSMTYSNNYEQVIQDISKTADIIKRTMS
jgi:uncharacterized protein with von Willebrand factor type A (vWA) domain